MTAVVIFNHEQSLHEPFRRLCVDRNLDVAFAPDLGSSHRALFIESADDADARLTEMEIVGRVRMTSPAVRVVLSSSSSGADVRDRARVLRAAVFKPESPDHIAELIDRLSAATDVPPERALPLSEVDAPMSVLDREGWMIDATPAARALLLHFHLSVELPAPLPETLARSLFSAPHGAAIVWHPLDALGSALGCTRYRLGSDRQLLLMREITERQRELSKRLHQQRLEATGGLVARIAHDLRTPLASIVYNIDLLEKESTAPETRATVRDIQLAADGMRRTIAALLDFARLGPPIPAVASLREIIARASSFVRPAFRAGQHELRIALHDEDALIQGNIITIEQILVNLLVNATESSDQAIVARITSEAVGDKILIRVANNGPAIPPEIAERVFEPFFTSKPNGTGLGLTVAREAAVSLGGSLVLEKPAAGCSFAVTLPGVRKPSPKGVTS